MQDIFNFSFTFFYFLYFLFRKYLSLLTVLVLFPMRVIIIADGERKSIKKNDKRRFLL